MRMQMMARSLAVVSLLGLLSFVATRPWAAAGQDAEALPDGTAPRFGPSPTPTPRAVCKWYGKLYPSGKRVIVPDPFQCQGTIANVNQWFDDASCPGFDDDSRRHYQVGVDLCHSETPSSPEGPAGRAVRVLCCMVP